MCRDCNLGSNPGTGAPPASGPLVCSVFCDYQTPQLDASANAVDGGDAPAGDADPDAVACSTPNPAEVTCLSSKGQCVPSTCGCSGAMGWVCTADCRSTTLPLCDGGTGADGKQDGAGEPDADLDAVTVDAPVLGNYTCRDDSDCCIVVDTCMEVAYLYSKAPGATAPPTFPPRTTCVPCIPPAVQVRCDQGQCVGQKLSTGIDYGSSLRSDHCGPIDLPDAAASIFQPAYAGAQQTSWGC